MRQSKIDDLSIALDTAIGDAIRRLTETAEKILFVADTDKVLVGTLTDGDIRRGIMKGLELNNPVSMVLNADFISMDEHSSHVRERAKMIMKQHRIGHIPVVNKDNGVIVDVISWVDYMDGDERKSGFDVEVVNDTPVVIMAGGKGMRLDPFTRILPKPLIPINDRPIIEHIMGRFSVNGFNKFVLILNYKKDLIKLYIHDAGLPYDIDIVEEDKYMGTAGGLLLLKERLGGTFVVTNCDTILEGDYSDILQWHKECGNLLTIIGSHKEIPIPYGVIKMKGGVFHEVDEKPKLDLFINTGTYILEPEILSFIPDGKSLDMDNLIRKAKVECPDNVGVFPYWGGWFDIGQWDEYKKSLKKISGHDEP